MKNYNFSGFIWSPAKQYENNILEDINKKFPVLFIHKYKFDNKNEFSKSILDIYTTDDISPEKVENVKIKNMLNHSLNYTYFQFYIKHPNFRKKQKTGNDISTSVEGIKKQIRQIYKTKVNNYIHDIIIHISDNFTQTTQIDSIMNKYIQYKQEEFINTKLLLRINYKRADMLVRKYTLERYLQNKSYNFDFYNLMQKVRVNRYTQPNFTSLIENINKNGFNNDFPIKCNQNYNLVDGSHRLACCYYYNITFVPVVRVPYKKILYNYQWFVDKQFPSKFLNILMNEYKILTTHLIN